MVGGDNFGQAVPDADVLVDWYPAGQTGDPFMWVTPGNHTIVVYNPSGYTRQYYVCANNTYPDLASTISITSDTSVIAYFTRDGQNPPTYQVTVPALDSNGNNIWGANVSIDGQQVGAAGGTFNVTSGCHSIYVSAPAGYVFQNYTYYITDPHNQVVLWVT